MRRTRTTRGLAAATATALTATLLGTSTAQAADPADTEAFREAVTVEGVVKHLEAFQAIADRSGGNRASGEQGYLASRRYIVQKLKKAGYKPRIQKFFFEGFSENSPTVLEQVTPDATAYEDGVEFAIMSYSAVGDVTAEVVAVDTDFTATDTSTSGCEPADFAGFPAGSIALMQRGSCSFEQKVANAADAGAAAAIIFNRGTAGNDTILFGTLGNPGAIPAIGTDFATGVDLGDPAGTVARVAADTTIERVKTWNVLAETATGNGRKTIMVGAHLDSVEDGPGINDNGSGSAGILEVAEEMAKLPPRSINNKVRFAWWGAEESGLLGSEHYVTDLAANDPRGLQNIAAYLNFDMIGSPNFVRFVYDGDNSTGEGATGPQGSAQIEGLFNDYFASQGLPTEPTAFDGRSDYGPFIAFGVPAGGLFTGAEDIKTEEQAEIYGGTAGEPYDPCYHTPCDDMTNLSIPALDQMTDAVAHLVLSLSDSIAPLKASPARALRTTAQAEATLATMEHKGNALTR